MAAIDCQRFTALGQEWTVRFDFNSICEIEERTGERFMVVAAPLLALVDLDKIEDGASMLEIAQRVDFANMRQLLRWALEGEHPEVDLKRAGELIQAIGLAHAIAVIATAIAKALPKEGGEASGDENPPKPKPKKSRKPKARKAG